MRTKINHVTVVTMDEQFHVYENGYVVLEGNTILETGEGRGRQTRTGQWTEKTGSMPGMINTHCHIPMIPFRSLGDDCPDRLRRFLFPLELETMNRGADRPEYPVRRLRASAFRRYLGAGYVLF